MRGLRVKNFRSKWYRMKRAMLEQHPRSFNRDMKLFYEVVDIDNTCGRRLTGSLRDLNPRYMDHWFATGRCHWNVIFPCWILNNRRVSGKYSIITNEKHSAIINTETMEIFDPTYTVHSSPDRVTLDQFRDYYEIDNVVTHCVRVNFDMFKRFMDFLPKKQRSEALKLVDAKVKSFTKHKVK